MKTWTIEMNDGGSEDEVTIRAIDREDALNMITQECEKWISKGDWGNDGGTVSVSWRLLDAEGELVHAGTQKVELPIDESDRIREAVGDSSLVCGRDPDDHQWSSEGEGGCDENPGVFGGAGGRLSTREHCSRCGLKRRHEYVGPQPNPGEVDQVYYELPVYRIEFVACTNTEAIIDLPYRELLGDEDARRLLSSCSFSAMVQAQDLMSAVGLESKHRADSQFANWNGGQFTDHKVGSKLFNFIYGHLFAKAIADDKRIAWEALPPMVREHAEKCIKKAADNYSTSIDDMCASAVESELEHWRHNLIDLADVPDRERLTWLIDEARGPLGNAKAKEHAEVVANELKRLQAN